MKKKLRSSTLCAIFLCVSLGLLFLYFRHNDNPDPSPHESPAEVLLDLACQEFEGGTFRVTAFLRNNSQGNLVFATKPLDARSAPSVLRNRSKRKVVLMVSVIRGAHAKKNEVYRDDQIGRIILFPGEVFRLFSLDFEAGEVEGHMIEAVYSSFPCGSYRDYWRGDLKASVLVSRDP